MEGVVLLGIFWAAVFLGNKIDKMGEEIKCQQNRIYKDLATGICHLIDESKKEK